MAVRMAVRMTLPVVMIMVIAQKQRAKQVDAEPDDGNQDGLIEANRYRTKQTFHAFITDEQRDHRERYRTRESREVAQLSGAKGQAGIVGVSPRIRIRQGRDKKRARMRGHVQSVGNERHRTEPISADNLGNHHRCANGNDRPGLSLVALMRRAQKHVRMPKVVD
jgi:hypothetical protein